MADVIFAGSPQRSALGMAEVRLVIDNTAGLIPVPMTEIEISRTIFRSGESEYRIGGQVVRLLDVQELLSESGIGRALHTVVGQGQLEDVLTSRPEDRRTYIEEAAGVAKHRKRKERAERKLAGLDQDVLRLQDVLAELRRQLKPLRQQAEMAKRHETLTAEADAVAVRLAAARLRDLWDERDRRKEGWDEGLARRTAARERLDALDGRVAAAADERARSVWALQEAEAASVEAQAAKSAAELELRRAVELESEARQAVASHDRERSRLEESLGQVRERGTAGEAEREALAADVERLDASTSPLGDRRSELERERHGLSDTVAELEEGRRRLELRRDVLRARLDDLERTPGSRFLEEHAGRGVGLLGQLIRGGDGWDRALRAGLGSLADAVVYEDAGRALAETLEQAAAKHAEHPRASFVTPDGVLVGPALIRTTLTADSRAEEVRRELAVVERDLARS